MLEGSNWTWRFMMLMTMIMYEEKVATEAAARWWDRDERANYWQVLHIKYECVGFVAELRWLPGSEGWMADIGSGSTRRGRIPSLILDDEGSSGKWSGQVIWSRITVAHKRITSTQLMKQAFCTVLLHSTTAPRSWPCLGSNSWPPWVDTINICSW